MHRLTIENARESGRAITDLSRTAVVTSSTADAALWREILRSVRSEADLPAFIAEDGRKGNLLGALQAYHKLSARPGGASEFSQMVMFVGSGSRLSPFTQAMGNMKSALPLPTGGDGADGLTIGEAAMRSSYPWIERLRANGFSGLVVRWGDEIYIPGSRLEPRPGTDFSSSDIVRFGWLTEPTEHLATQKEWFIADRQSGHVCEDISRQPLPMLASRLERDYPSDHFDAFVNLGTFAASHEFFLMACLAFEDVLYDNSVAANWDPYFWRALETENEDRWKNMLATELADGTTAGLDLERSIPDFFARIVGLKQAFRQRYGRNLEMSVLDFGETYWLDVGTHDSLAHALEDILADNADGTVIRAFLNLPEGLANGESYISASSVPTECIVENSVIIGSEIGDGASVVRGSVLLGCRLGHIDAGVGSAAVWCRVDDLRLVGPRSIAVRVAPSEDGAIEVAAESSVATVVLTDTEVTLQFPHALGTLRGEVYNTPVSSNVVSFEQSASAMSQQDTPEVHRRWRTVLGHASA